MTILGDGLHHGELVGPHGAGTDVADLTALNEVVQDFDPLFDGRVVVKAVDLWQVYVICPQPGERGVYGAEDRCSRQTCHKYTLVLTVLELDQKY